MPKIIEAYGDLCRKYPYEKPESLAHTICLDLKMLIAQKGGKRQKTEGRALLDRISTRLHAQCMGRESSLY